MDITDWIGTVGVFILLLAYFLVVINVIETKGIIYILMNLFGAPHCWSSLVFAKLLAVYHPRNGLDSGIGLFALRFSKVERRLIDSL